MKSGKRPPAVLTLLSESKLRARREGFKLGGKPGSERAGPEAEDKSLTRRSPRRNSSPDFRSTFQVLGRFMVASDGV
eukprot:2803711-Rhodomonas_salina.1